MRNELWDSWDNFREGEDDGAVCARRNARARAYRALCTPRDRELAPPSAPLGQLSLLTHTRGLASPRSRSILAPTYTTAPERREIRMLRLCVHREGSATAVPFKGRWRKEREGWWEKEGRWREEREGWREKGGRWRTMKNGARRMKREGWMVKNNEGRWRTMKKGEEWWKNMKMEDGLWKAVKKGARRMKGEAWKMKNNEGRTKKEEESWRQDEK